MSAIENVDRISNLPSDLTDRILQLLPFKDAIRTSTLSTHWRYQWLLRSQLKLDQHFFSAILKFNCSCKDYNERYDCQIPHDLFSHSDDLVTHMLLRLVGPIRKFSIHIPHWFPEDTDIINHWMEIVSGKFVERLSVYQHDGARRELPSCVFASVGFDHLRKLTVIDCGLPSIPSTFRGFPLLTELDLFISIGNANTVNKVEMIVSICPMLGVLCLRIYEKEGFLKIDAPRLTELVVTGELSCICLEETNELKYFSLGMAWREETLTELFVCLPHIEKLGFDDEFWETEWLKEVEDTKKLKFMGELRQLKYLKLVLMPIGCQWAISFVISLLQTIPKLETLEIDVLELLEPSPDNVTLEGILEGSCHFDHLKSANITSLYCTSSKSYMIMLQLIKLILSSSPVLEVLTFEVNVPSEEKLNIEEEELLQYHRASPNAKIIFKKMQNV